MKSVMKHLQAEKVKIAKEMGALQKRLDAIDLVFATLGAPMEKPERKPVAKVAVKKPRVKRVAAKGGMTVREAIVQTVAEAKEPLAVKDIIKGAVPLCGGAVASIRTQINGLAKEGFLKQLPYAGRGFLYGIGTAGKKPARKPGRKPAVAAAPAPEAAPAPPPVEGAQA